MIAASGVLNNRLNNSTRTIISLLCADFLHGHDGLSDIRIISDANTETLFDLVA